MFDRQEALKLLDWANELNPGPWRAHSLGVARAAGLIAGAIGIDEERAYITGLMHDIGRYEGVRGMHHVIAGHDLMMDKGQPECARICITHSFPDKRMEGYLGAIDVTDDEYACIERSLAGYVFDDYDRIVQLCDAISWNEGVCLMEKRLVNVVLRHGTAPGIREKWQAYFAIKEDLERRMGRSLYSLFPECWENTLG